MITSGQYPMTTKRRIATKKPPASKAKPRRVATAKAKAPPPVEAVKSPLRPTVALHTGDSTLAFALASARTTLGAGGATVRETAAGVEFWYGDTPYATLATTPDRLVVAFLAPRGTALSTRAKFYPVAERAGWVRVELPVSRDPRPWLEADIGATVGQTIWELKQGGDRPITSAGGPYVVVPASEVAFWKPKTKLGKIADDVSVITLPTCDVLALGAPDTLHWIPSAKGGVLARVISMDADDPTAVARHVASVTEARWEARGTFHLRTPSLLAYDASISGLKIKLTDTLQLGLTPARYAVSAATVKPDDGTELLLVRLAR